MLISILISAVLNSNDIRDDPELYFYSFNNKENIYREHWNINVSMTDWPLIRLL